MLFLCGFYELVRVRGAGAVRVARDELVAFVVHRVAQRARQRHQEANERDAEDEDAAREVESLASRDLSSSLSSVRASTCRPSADRRHPKQ